MIGTTAEGNGAPEGAHDTPDHKKPRPQQAWGAGSAFNCRGSNPLSGFCQTPDAILALDSTGKGAALIQAIITAGILLGAVVLGVAYAFRGFRKSRQTKHPLSGMAFKDTMSFFDYQCRYGDTTIEKGRICYALVVLDATHIANQQFGPSEPGYQILSVLPASPQGDNGKSYMTPHNGNIEQLKPWDLVAWAPYENHPVVGWRGVIVAKCAPEFVDTGVKVLRMF